MWSPDHWVFINNKNWGVLSTSSSLGQHGFCCLSGLSVLRRVEPPVQPVSSFIILQDVSQGPRCSLSCSILSLVILPGSAFLFCLFHYTSAKRIPGSSQAGFASRVMSQAGLSACLNQAIFSGSRLLPYRKLFVILSPDRQSEIWHAFTQPSLPFHRP